MTKFDKSPPPPPPVAEGTDQALGGSQKGAAKRGEMEAIRGEGIRHLTTCEGGKIAVRPGR